MIAVPFIYFSLLTILLVWKDKALSMSSYILLIYAFSSLCAILVDAWGIYNALGVRDKIEISPEATMTYCTLLSLSILPFRHITSSSTTQILMQNERLIDAVSWLLIGTFVVTLGTLATDINQVFHSDLNEIRSQIYHNKVLFEKTGIARILTLPSMLFGQLAPMAILFFFCNIVYKRKSLLFNYLLLASSLTPVLSAILIAGRTQPIYWVMTFFLLYFLFRPMMSAEAKKQIVVPVLVIAGITILFIGSVTISRFTSQSSTDLVDVRNSIISYAGQSFINFNDFYCNYTPSGVHLDRIFPLYTRLFVDSDWDLNTYRDFIWSESGMNIGIFYTFLGDLMVDTTKTGMWIYVLLFSILAGILCRRPMQDGAMPLSRLLVIIMLILIPLRGLFYYSYYRVDVSLYILGTLLLAMALTFKLHED